MPFDGGFGLCPSGFFLWGYFDEEGVFEVSLCYLVFFYFGFWCIRVGGAGFGCFTFSASFVLGYDVLLDGTIAVFFVDYLAYVLAAFSFYFFSVIYYFFYFFDFLLNG